MAEANGPLLAGFDAGQTHTTCRLAALLPDGSWAAVAEGQGGGVSHLAADGGSARFVAAIRGSLEAALSQAGLHPNAPLAAAAIGASGIEAGSPVQQQGSALAAECLGVEAARVVVVGDERTALAGAFGGAAGILVISGTGCIALGSDGQGRSHRCGGWGWLLDGAGSAMDLGRDGLALSVQMADGRLAETALRAGLWRALGASSAQEVKAAVVTPNFGAAGFARLAPVVDLQALQGDPHAQAVIQRSAAALAAMVHTIAVRLELQEPAVCGVGGALGHLRSLQRAFSEALQQRLPGAQQQAPAGDACAGALTLAAQAALRC
ncbi:MAG: N-acetylglucosamine kinase [Cyanobacteria bacterium M_surface_10_m2_179]|nr:N-acetylglucosamine kinase [Cyanobacteria bacterium M_surface_10_m2_179]